MVVKNKETEKFVQDTKEMEYKEMELRERLETPSPSHRNLQSKYLKHSYSSSKSSRHCLSNEQRRL
jgi:hypothetical protein